MGVILAVNMISLDGFYADPDGNPTVLNMDSAFNEYNLERMRNAGTILLGRRSFEMFSSYWPGIADAPQDPEDPALDATNREFSGRYNSIRKVVVSDTLDIAPDNPWKATSEVVRRSDVTTRLETGSSEGAGDIVMFASRTTWNGLLVMGLLEELHLIVGPAAIGAGVPLFTGPTSLSLSEARRFEGSDNALLRYRTTR